MHSTLVYINKCNIITIILIVRPSERSGSWTLVVENCQPEDAGSYRCQVRYIERYTESYIVFLVWQKYCKGFLVMQRSSKLAKLLRNVDCHWKHISRPADRPHLLNVFSCAAAHSHKEFNQQSRLCFPSSSSWSNTSQGVYCTALGVYGSRTMSFGLVAYPAFR